MSRHSIDKSIIYDLFFYGIVIVMVPSLAITPSVFAQQRPGSVSNNNNNTLKILSHNSFIDSAGYFHVVGEVENVSPNPVELVKVIGTFYDVNGKVVGTDFSFTNPAILSAGDKAPFELILTSASIPVKEIDNYRLSIDWLKGGEAATTVLPSDFGSNNILIGNENFVKKTELYVVHCGEKVTGTIKLTANLNCPNHGLIVENNTVVNMDGYSIRGPGQKSSKVVLVIPNPDNVVIQGPGDISNFQAGILVKGANHATTVSENNIYGSQNGVFADARSLGNTVSMNNVLHNVIDLNNAK